MYLLIDTDSQVSNVACGPLVFFYKITLHHVLNLLVVYNDVQLHIKGNIINDNIYC